MEQAEDIQEAAPEPARDLASVPPPVADEPLERPQPRRYEPPPRVEQPRQHEEPFQDEEPQQDEEPLPRTAAAYEETAEQEPVAYQPDEEPAAPVVAPPPRAEFPDDEETKSPFSNPIVLGLVGALVVLLAVMGWLLTRATPDGGLGDGEGELVVQSRPEGAQVRIDGEVKGNTPLTVRLDAGAHVIEVQSGKSAPRVIPLMITAGMQTSQYVELQGVEKTGSLEIRSDPAGARITIDGRPRGTTPTTVSDLTPGDHTVVLESGGRKVSQTVRIQAGTAQQLSVPMRR